MDTFPVEPVRGYDSPGVVRKGGCRDVLAFHPNAAQRIKASGDGQVSARFRQSGEHWRSLAELCCW
jgi:hypothetical protein